MRKIFTTLTAALFVMLGATAAEQLDIRKITNGTYSAQGVGGMRSMNDGEHYMMIGGGGTCLVRYAFKTGEVVDTLFSVHNTRGCDFKRFDGYIMSPAEDRILIQTNTKSIYRRSFTAEYYIYDVKNRKMVPLSNGGPQQVPSFSPDGKMVAFVRDNNIHLVKLMFNNSESQVTTDGKFNEILNGIPDWVYEEEFTMNKCYEFSADSKMIAYVKSIESHVPSFSFTMYRGMAPSYEENALYPGAYTYKYPLPGVDNSKVSVHTFDIKSMVTRKIDLQIDEEDYIPRIHFTSDPEKLAIVTLNRHQNRMDIYMANPRSTVCKLVLREESPTYINEATYQDIRFYPNNFILQSQRNNYNHLYLYNLNGQLVRQLTDGEYEVTNFYGWNENTGDIYYQSNEPSPLRRAIYHINKKGKKTRLTPETGTSDATFSKNLQNFVHTHSDIHTPPVITIENVKGKVHKTLVDNKVLAEKLNQPGMPSKEFFQFTTSNGTVLNGWMVKPAENSEFSQKETKYPVIMYQYSGPGSQEVLDNWRTGFYGGTLWESFLAQQGYIVVCVDGRGTGGRGAEFKNCTYLKLGLFEAEDQVETAKYLATLPYVDKSRIGIWGWSFGGYNTLMSMSSGEPVFKAGIAVAPPTYWKYYDSVYTERFMRTPQENGENYEKTSPINRASNLNGSLLLMHGMADDNVHVRNSMEYAEALVQADKQFDMFYYTNRNHSIYGGNTRYHIFNKMLNFWNEKLR
ncbi:MAG: S9 family peptidase [Bacteroidaceae bacterium]|nr:S9 family peptidase [Bacteroidaceae bacterium]